MKLTLMLLRRNYLPNGNMYRGKDRLVKKVTPAHLRTLREDFKIEEQNMLYLRHPYITEEQSFGHAKALGKPEKRAGKFKEYTSRIFKDDVTLFDRYLHLRVNEGWDK